MNTDLLFLVLAALTVVSTILLLPELGAAMREFIFQKAEEKRKNITTACSGAASRVYYRHLPRMGDRAVDCARLESVCAARHRGFESPPIRHTATSFGVVSGPSSRGVEKGLIV